MLHYIDFGGKELPVDFNIRTLIRVAKAYNTDLTGLQEVFANFTDEEDYITFVGNIGSVALTEGSRREGGGIIFTPDDVYDIITVDMSIAQQLIDMLFETMRGTEVFPAAAAPTKPPKKKATRKE